MSDCIFCRIIAGEIPGHFVHQDEQAVILMDINQGAPGHLLLVPRRHVEFWHELAGDEAAHLARLSVPWARAMMAVAQAEGYNLAVNNGAAASQEVRHVHMHLIPRVSGDRVLRYGGTPRIAEADELRERAAAIRNAYEG